MNNNMKKLLSVVLAIVMVLVAFPVSVLAGAPSKPATPTATSTESSVTVKWKTVKNAKGYTLYRYDVASKKTKTLKTLSKTSYTDSKLPSGKSYAYFIKAYNLNTKKAKVYSKASSKVYISTRPSKPASLKTSSVTYNSVKLSWAKVSGATGYKVQYSTSSSFSSPVSTTVSSSSKSISSLKSGKKYYFRVYAVREYNKKVYTSSASSTVSVKTLADPTPARVSSVKAEKTEYDSVTITWAKVANATSYKVQCSASKSFASPTTATVTGLSKTFSSLKENTTYYFRVYAIRNYNNKVFTSSASEAISVKTPLQYPDDNTVVTRSVVDTSVKYQTMDGFGASGCWWAQKVGGWGNADDYLKYLYDKEEGIGLNIYRYNVGGGSDVDDKLSRGASAETFLKGENGSYKSSYTFKDSDFDWTRDANAQKALALAQKYADKSGRKLRVSLFANSPPRQLTKNGRACVSYYDYMDGDNNPIEDIGWVSFEGLNGNIDSKNFELFVDYLVNIADHFEAQGYDVVDVSPVNEPQYSWSCDQNGYMSQEGCHYSPSATRELFSICAERGAEIKNYKFSMFDSCAADGDDESSWCKYQGGFAPYFNNIMSSKKNASYYDSVSVHSYWQVKDTKQKTYKYIQSKKPGMKVACTEYCQMTNDASTGVFDISSPIPWWEKERNGITIEYGVQMARIINEDLTCLNASEWCWWTAVSGGYYPDGLVYYDGPTYSDDVTFDSSAKPAFTSKRLWCLGNYSRFIECGAKRVKISESNSAVRSSAFVNPDGSIVVVYVNDSSKDLTSSLSCSKSNYEVYTTSATQDLEKTASGKKTGSSAVSVSVPSQSVVTAVLR